MKANGLSPMMAHYMSIKEKNQDAIVFYRLGDFYEMFFDDAITASAILDITLTARDCGLSERAPMCGIPYHAADEYIAKLIAAGKKVAICEQTSTPKDQKGLVQREITKIVTAGTVTDEEKLDGARNNYLMAVFATEEIYSIAYADITTGELLAAVVDKEQAESLILNVAPSEIIANRTAYRTLKARKEEAAIDLADIQDYFFHVFEQKTAEREITAFYGVASLDSYGLKQAAIPAIGALLHYISATQRGALKNILPPRMIDFSQTMFLDYATIRNLEILESLHNGTRKGSLLAVLDKTQTKMGARIMRKWLTEPLRNINRIEERLQAQKELIKNSQILKNIVANLNGMRDIERLCQRVAARTVRPQDLLSICDALKRIDIIKKSMQKFKGTLLGKICSSLNPQIEVANLLSKAINEDAPFQKNEGQLFKVGYNASLDKYRDAERRGRQWIADYEALERQKTGIKTLKVGFSRVIGYFIEVPNTYRDSTPLEYARRQTVSNAERYTSNDLKQLEEVIQNSNEKVLQLEAQLYEEIKTLMLDVLPDLQLNALSVGILDVLTTAATTAINCNYTMPQFVSNGDMTISACRHPVVESFKRQGEYIANEVMMDANGYIQLITGPNMAGKSTYMRSVALCVLMAQCGFYVAATEARLPCFDRIFTRIGAGDNLSSGQSTFMVEMIEMAAILSGASKDSLVILDEVGRGTSTLDGISIAWAIVEHIALKLKAKTLFATHYHELSELETLLPAVKNYNILIREQSSSIVFLYKIARGASNRSFGIEVAKMAGILPVIIERARRILHSLEENHILSGDLTQKLEAAATDNAVPVGQMAFFDEKPNQLEKILQETDLDNCTPMQALTILTNMKRLIKKGK